MHIIEQFNGGIYDTIIASDEKMIDFKEENTNQTNSDPKKNSQNKK